MFLVFTVISETEWWKASLEETRVHWAVQVDKGSEWGPKSQVKQDSTHSGELYVFGVGWRDW